jgi:hypothetical protein
MNTCAANSTRCDEALWWAIVGDDDPGIFVHGARIKPRLHRRLCARRDPYQSEHTRRCREEARA